MTTTIKYSLSVAGQKASILSGANGQQQQTLTVESTDSDFAAVIERATIDRDGNACLAMFSWQDPSFDAPQTVASIIAALREREAAKVTQEAADKAELREETLAVLAARKTKKQNGCESVEAKDDAASVSVKATYYPQIPDWPYAADKSITESPEAVAWLADLELARAAQIEAAKVEAAEKLEAAVAAKLEDDRVVAEKAAARAVLRAERGLEDGDLALNIEDGCLAQVPVNCWESHKRGKNWLAIIAVDPKSPGGLHRDFADKAKGDLYYLLPTFATGDAIEFGADYYSGGGRKNAHRWYGYVVRVEADYVVLRACSTGKAAVKAGEKFIASQIKAANL